MDVSTSRSSFEVVERSSAEYCLAMQGVLRSAQVKQRRQCKRMKEVQSHNAPGQWSSESGHERSHCVCVELTCTQLSWLDKPHRCRFEALHLALWSLNMKECADVDRQQCMGSVVSPNTGAERMNISTLSCASRTVGGKYSAERSLTHQRQWTTASCISACLESIRASPNSRIPKLPTMNIHIQCTTQVANQIPSQRATLRN